MGTYGFNGFGLGQTTRQIDPAVPGIITASGGAVRDVTGGIADIWRASRGESPPSDAPADSGASDFVDPGRSGSFFETTGGKVVIIGGVALALLAVGLVVLGKKDKKEKKENRRRRRNGRMDDLRAALAPGWSVKTYSPGDGVTRYRFFYNAPVGQSYFGPANGRYTALGFKEAMAFARGTGSSG